MPHEYEEYDIKISPTEVGDPPPPTPEVLNNTVFTESNPKDLIDTLLRPTQHPMLDRIRSITFSSLNTEDPTNETRGVFRGIQLLFSLGKGHFLKHAVSLDSKWLEQQDITKDEIKGRPLSSIVEDNSAYERLFNEYLKIYSKDSNFRKDLIGLCNVEDVVPKAARPIVRLLLLIIISTRFEA